MMVPVEQALNPTKNVSQLASGEATVSRLRPLYGFTYAMVVFFGFGVAFRQSSDSNDCNHLVAGYIRLSHLMHDSQTDGWITADTSGY